MKTQSDSLFTEPWLSWAIEIQSIAQNGLTIAKNIYDIERYERLRICLLKCSLIKQQYPKTVKSFFCNGAGYQTPKIDSRAAIFKDDKILLVQETDGLWSLPGGWIDVLETIHSNTIKKYAKKDLMLNPRSLLPFTNNINAIFRLLRILYSKPSSCEPLSEVNSNQIVKQFNLPILH